MRVTRFQVQLQAAGHVWLELPSRSLSWYTHQKLKQFFFYIFFISSFQKQQIIKELTISKKLSVCRCQWCPTFQDLTKYLRLQSLLITILFGHTVLCKIDISTLISDIFAEEGRRTLYKAYGIKFVIIVQGIAGAEQHF